jgi:hypothetical protein
MLGLPGSRAAAGSGYVPFAQLQPIVQNIYNTYSSFGGIRIWGNKHIDVLVISFFFINVKLLFYYRCL